MFPTSVVETPARVEQKCGEYNQDNIRNRLEGPQRTHVIITEPMIIDCLNELMPTGDEGKYAKMVKMDIKMVTFLRMEFRSISEIANLKIISNLTKLQLCNNVIKKIQNLDVLVHLVWLDLSYNSIRKIEGLDKLTKLEVLDLHRNFITTLENLDHNLRLQMFHISTNKLDDLENLRYLRRLARLRSVALQGNPVSMDPEFIHYFIAFVPQVDLIDYVIVPQIERDIANARHKQHVEKYAKTEDQSVRRASVVEAEEEVQQLHKLAFVDGLQEDQFWESLYEEDFDGKELLGRGDTEDIQFMFKELFRRATKEIFDKGMRAYEERQNEINAYKIAIAEESDKVQKPGNAMTEDFVEYGGQTLKDVRILVSLIEDNERRVQNGLAHELPPEFPEFQNQLNILMKEYVGRLHDIWFRLIHREMDFDEQMEIVNDLLDQSVREVVTNWLELLRGQFGQLRDIEQQLTEKLQETLGVKREAPEESYISDEEEEGNEDEEEEDEDDEEDEDWDRTDDEITNDMSKSVVEPTETASESEMDNELANSIQASHDHHVSVIDGKEESICQRMNNWQDTFSRGLVQSEFERNKARLNEISHFVDTHYGYLEETRCLEHATVHIPPVRADQECTDPKSCEPLLWYESLKKRLRAREKQFKQSMQPKQKEVNVSKMKSKLTAAVPTRSSFVL